MDKPLGAAAGAVGSNDPTTAKSDHLTSPARSDRSDDSEGRPVREKLKETRIDGKGNSDQAAGNGQSLNPVAANGHLGEASTSGSDNERGRLRRKRSREDFEEEAEDANHQEKKHERHTRKKSRDMTSPVGSDVEVPKLSANGSVAPIAEDVHMAAATGTVDRKATPEVMGSDNDGGVTSPKNKRKLEQTTPGHEAAAGSARAEGRNTKRSREGADSEPVTQVTETNPTKSLGSGFSNTSAASPFASMAPKSPTKPTDAPAKDLPQTSDTAFKKSGFGAFSSSAASPFAAAGKSGSASPFGAATGSTLSSFASSKPASSTPAASGFASLGGTTSSFSGGLSSGKTTFGGALGGSAFGSVLGSKPALSSFGAGGSITGLKEKAAPEFGASEAKVASDDDADEDGDDNDDDNGDEENDRRGSQPLLSATGPPETGEENEITQWSGRAKLYAFVNHDGKKSWTERGKGPLKLNISREGPKKARFVLRADGTHRLLLNAAITSQLKIGDSSGNEPKDGRLLFAAPTATGEIETLMLSLNSQRAIDLWEQVDALKQSGSYA